jgi:hypothetical protein
MRMVKSHLISIGSTGIDIVASCPKEVMHAGRVAPNAGGFANAIPCWQEFSREFAKLYQILLRSGLTKKVG